MFQVLHARKIPTQVGLINVLAHNSREKLDQKNPEDDFRNPDWEPDGLHKNGVPYAQALALRTAQLQGLKRKPQKNASKAIEFNISAGEGFGNWQQYFLEASFFLKAKFGFQNCISTAIHTDETSPHMHMVFVPIMTNAKGERVYSSSNFLGGRNGLTQLQTEFYEQVGKKFGLERGVEGSRAKHSDVQDFKRKVKALKAQEKTLLERNNELLTRSKALDDRESSLNEKEAQINAKGEILGNYMKHAKENSLEVLQECEQTQKNKFHTPWDLPKFMQKVYESVCGAWALVKKLTDKNQKLEEEKAQLRKQNQIWREETTPEQFREIAETLDKNHCRNWKQFKIRQKRESQGLGLGY